MMFAQLGDIIFEGLKGFDSLSVSVSSSIAQHQLIGGKPKLQGTGSEAQAISLSISLNAAFCTPENEIAALEKARSEYQVLPLIDGTGRVYGDYVIQSLEYDISKTDTSGAIVSASVTIELIESYDEEKAKARALAARNAAFAVSSMNPIQATTVSAGTDATQLMGSLQSAKAEASAIDKSINTAQAAGGIERIYAETKQRVDNVVKHAQDIQQRLLSAQRLYNLAEGMYDQAGNVITNCTSMYNAISSGSLLGLVNANNIFQSSIVSLDNTSVPIITAIATRKV